MEVKRLLKENIIEPSKSPWRAQVLIMTNENHKKRMVVHYSQTINRYTQLGAYPLPRIDEMVSNITKYRIFSMLDLRSANHQIPIKPEEKPYVAFEACEHLYQFHRIPFGVTNGVASFQRVIDEIISNEKLKGTVIYIENVTVCGYNEKDHNHNLKEFMAAVNKYDLTLNEEKCSYNLKSIVRNGAMRPDPERRKPLMELPIPGNIAALRRALGMFAHYSQWVASFSEKIHLLTQIRTFPLSDSAIRAFQNLKRDIANSAIAAINLSAPLVVENMEDSTVGIDKPKNANLKMGKCHPRGFKRYRDLTVYIYKCYSTQGFFCSNDEARQALPSLHGLLKLESFH